MSLTIVVNHLADFYERVGIMSLDDFDGLGIEPCAAPYYFFAGGLARLTDFVGTRSGYHIVSLVSEGSVIINRYVDGAHAWKLACGDSDPNIVCVCTEELLVKTVRLCTRGRSGAERGHD
jgi:hypothetical protein